MTHNQLDAILEIGHSLLAELELERLLPKMTEQVLRHSGASQASVVLKRGSRYWVVCQGRIRPGLEIETRGKPLAQVRDLSQQAIFEAEQTRRDVVVNGAAVNGGRPDPSREHRKDWVIPLLANGATLGFLYLARAGLPGDFDDEAREFMQLLSPAMVLALANALKFGKLHHHTRELQEQLEDRPAAPKAEDPEWNYLDALSRAKRASEVLHKMGNTLNCALLIGEDLTDRLEETKIASFLKANEMLERHAGSRATFLTEDPRGKLLPDFYLEFGHILREERDSLNREIVEINRQLETMRELMWQYQTGPDEN